MDKMRFLDSLRNVLSSVANRRNQLTSNEFVQFKLDNVTLRAIYKTGLANKIVRVKSSYSLNKTICFADEEGETYYSRRLKKHIRDAVTYMMAFGRGVVVLHEQGADLSRPLPVDIDPDSIMINTFSGDMVSTSSTSRDLGNPRYGKPTFYNINANNIHYSRIVDYTYVNPTEIDSPNYSYGGISEFELIYNQLVSDAIVERASASIIEKNSTLFYKIDGFKDKLQSKQEKSLIKYFTALEDGRSIYGAGLLDMNDDVMAINQTLSDLKEVNENSLRRVAMVTDIPMSILIGENVKGLNSTGDNELKIFQDSILNLQENYILNPTNHLLSLLKQEPISFKEVQWETPLNRVQYQAVVLDNAQKLKLLDEDYEEYLEDKEVTKKNRFDDFFEIPFPDTADEKQNESEVSRGDSH